MIEFFIPPKFSEQASLAYFGGWVLKATLVCPPYMKRLKPALRSEKCQVCRDAFIINFSEDDQEVNKLLQLKLKVS